MGGSRNSSIGNSNGREILICGCNLSMKMWVSNTHENPKRKFWRCKIFGKSDITRDLFIWDDEVEEVILNNPNKERFTSAELECNKCELVLSYLKEFGNNFGKEFGKEYGKESSSKKVEELKMLLQFERKKNFWIMIALIVSWMLLAIVVGLL